jgi:hypothetical protein
MDTTATAPSTFDVGATASYSAPIAASGPIELLLRDRDTLIADLAAGRRLATTARAMLITIAIGAALFGAAIGIYRGGIQIVYAAVKLPLVLIFTAAIAAPALTAFNLALDRPSALRRDLALALCSLALGALVLAAEAPLILVARALDAGYHETILLVVGCCAVAGLASLTFLARGLWAQARSGAYTAALLLCGVMIVVGAQAAWTMRPYLVRPRTVDVPFVRDVEGSLLEAVITTVDSAQGTFRRDEAPLPGDEEHAP